MPTKLPKNKGYTKAFSKTKLAFQIDREIAKGEFLWQYDYKPKLEDNAWHPSGHCTPSVFELYHYAKESKPIPLDVNPDDGGKVEIAPRSIEAGLGKIFQVGHFWHQYLQEVCVRAGFCDKEHVERSGKRVWGETTFHMGDGVNVPLPFHWATGSADICPCEIPGHGPYLIDFKTMGSHQFRGNRPSLETLIKWECQLNIYMDFFEIDKAIILGINKDSPHDFKEFEFHYNDELVEKIYWKWQLVAECLDNKVEPPESEVVELPTKGPINA